MRASALSTNPMKQQKPLDILEIRTNIGWYLDLTDVYSCALVCRDWAKTFIPLLWYTIDFSVQPQIPLSILKKHVRHVRRLEHLDLSEQEGDTLRLLCFGSGIRHLRHLSIAFCESDQVNIHGFDLLRRNRASLTFLRIIRKPFEPEVDIVPAQYCIPPDVLVHPTGSRLTDLSLHNTILTRDGFTHILRSSPCLKRLNLAASNILAGGYIDTMGAKGTGRDCLTDQDSENGYYSDEEDVDTLVVDEAVIKWRPFRHQGVIELAATLQEIFNPDPSIPSPSLLRHFPRLQELYLSGLELIPSIKSSVVRNEVKACCPDLCTVGFSSSPSPAVEELIINAFENLAAVHFEKHNYTVGVFHGLLHHNSTLTSIVTYADQDTTFDSIQPEPIDDLFKDQGRVIQLLFQILPLKSVCFHAHEMKIEWMEEKPWRGTLEELSVRIEGLDTEQKIEKVRSAWVECWNKYRDVLRQSANPLLEDSKVGFSGTAKQDIPADIVVKLEPVDENHMISQVNGNQGGRDMLAPRAPNPLDFFVNDGSLEARVTRFLIQQPNLRDICLGNGYWTL
ncbi:hypothetical protein EC957_004413 [Mortierella hygrophila]|uniref:F-box domain-containing protein n=1 Tax=Mortierella hygrophila TaxID=979708 RepID=A0A9P6F1K4_9FUNG|nr:hypothetical protein EC957_004413 [Mortierella hygrophila]